MDSTSGVLSRTKGVIPSFRASISHTATVSADVLPLAVSRSTFISDASFWQFRPTEAFDVRSKGLPVSISHIRFLTDFPFGPGPRTRDARHTKHLFSSDGLQEHPAYLGTGCTVVGPTITLSRAAPPGPFFLFGALAVATCGFSCSVFACEGEDSDAVPTSSWATAAEIRLTYFFIFLSYFFAFRTVIALPDDDRLDPLRSDPPL